MITPTAHPTSTNSVMHCPNEQQFKLILPSEAKLTLSHNPSFRDIKTATNHYRELCNEVCYMGFIDLGIHPVQNQQEITTRVSNLQQLISSIQRNIIGRILPNVPVNDRAIQETGTIQSMLLPVQMGNLNGGKFIKGETSLPYSILRLNTGVFVHMTNSPKTEALQFLETKLNRSLKPFLSAPTTAGKTEPKLVLGQGGQGRVRIGVTAKHPSESADYCKPVAIKKSKQESAALREIHNAKTYTSEYLPEFHGYAISQDRTGTAKFYLAYDVINGGDGLAQIPALERLSLTDDDAHYDSLVSIGREYSKAIASLHAQGCYHSDVKPDNFLHSTDGKVFLNDLGLAHNDRQKFAGGTFSYLPPEYQTPRYDAAKHDSFSLGITLLAMATGGLEMLNASIHLESSPQDNDQEIPFPMPLLQVARDGYPRFSGVANSSQITINGFHDLVIRLLDRDPAARLSIEEAVLELHSMAAPSIPTA